MTITGMTTCSWTQVVPIMPPAVHMETSFDILKARPMPSAIAYSKVETATPASTIRSGENPPFFMAPMPNTMKAPTAAPAKHASMME
ncbi:Uncharacterised protein [Mycobacterium tuberculosis]|nr:Uncharacterised protein [Mycobacterium tuberculosis]